MSFRPPVAPLTAEKPFERSRAILKHGGRAYIEEYVAREKLHATFGIGCYVAAHVGAAPKCDSAVFPSGGSDTSDAGELQSLDHIPRSCIKSVNIANAQLSAI